MMTKGANRRGPGTKYKYFKIAFAVTSIDQLGKSSDAVVGAYYHAVSNIEGDIECETASQCTRE